MDHLRTALACATGRIPTALLCVVEGRGLDLRGGSIMQPPEAMMTRDRVDASA